MKTAGIANIFAVIAGLQTVSYALPAKRQAVDDATVLNFALTLEHLENTFYSEGLQRYSQDNFVAAGYPSWVRNRLEQISSHEATHVEFLTTALQAAGAQPVARCEYTFPHNDPSSFMDLSSILEGVGSGAYTGAAQFIANKEYLTAAASILAIEARHSSWINSAVQSSNGWPGAFETALSPNQVYTMASGFITSCPSTNAPLPFTAFPSLGFPNGAHPGQTAELVFDLPQGFNAEDKLYAAILHGIQTEFVEITISNDGNTKEMAFPSDLCGPVYVLITKDNSNTDDASTIAGPAPMRFRCNSEGQPM